MFADLRVILKEKLIFRKKNKKNKQTLKLGKMA